MYGDWQQLIQTLLIGIFLSFFFAKLISLATATTTTTTTTVTTTSCRENRTETAGELIDDFNFVLAEKGSVAGGDVATIGDVVSDDDWEGVESTELDKEFSAATVFVTRMTAEKGKLSNEVQLQLYGLNKIPTEGPCSAPPPRAFKMTACAKWNAWQKLGAMPPEDAMQKYVDIITRLFPTWANGGADKPIRDTDIHRSDSKGPIGPLFSSLIHEKEFGDDLKMEAIHAFAREGDVDSLLKCIENGIPVNIKDSDGRTPLHWAVDRGHFPVIELLFKNDANVNVKDKEGQTPLHYAIVCDREAVAEYLVKHNADVHAKDNDGISPSKLCDKNWSSMRPAEHVVE